MRLTDQLVLVCSLLTACSEANPLTQTHDPHAFSVNQVARPAIPHKFRGRHAVNKVLRKFGNGNAPSVPHLNHAQQPIIASSKAKSKAYAPSGAGQSTADSEQQDLEYVCHVEVGGQKTRLNFDTGSSDLWVYSTLQPPDQKKGNHSIYDPKVSKTGQEVKGGTWQITYGDNSAAGGVVHKDTVKVGQIVAEGQAIELAKNVSDSFSTDYSNSGLLGLGFSKGTTKDAGNTIFTNGKPDPQPTFFETVRPKLPLPLFTADLKHNAPGSYDFGFIDKSKYTGDVKYFPADSSSAYWGITSQRYAVKGQKGVEKNIKTIIDTGTTLLLMPQDVLDAYYKQIPNSRNDTKLGGYVFPCGQQIPDFLIGFGSAPNEFTATIAGKYMDFGPASTDDTKTCFGGMQIMSASDTLDAIYGDIFLKAVFTVFEAKPNAQPRLGFAMKPDSGVAPNPTPTGPNPPAPTCTSSPPGSGSNPGVTIFSQWYNNIQKWFTGKKDGSDICPAPPPGSGSPDGGAGGDPGSGDGGDGDGDDDDGDEGDYDDGPEDEGDDGDDEDAKKDAYGKNSDGFEKKHQKRMWEEDFDFYDY